MHQGEFVRGIFLSLLQLVGQASLAEEAMRSSDCFQWRCRLDPFARAPDECFLRRAVAIVKSWGRGFQAARSDGFSPSSNLAP